jgi:signal transduction histidine kinase
VNTPISPLSAVLIVDDEADMLSGLRRLLSLDSYRIDSASSLAEMMDRDDLANYFAILLDRKLPDGYAEDVLPRLKLAAPDAAIIIITGYGDLDSTIAAMRNGASDYILKPVNPDALRACLSRLTLLKQAESRAMHAERLAAVGEMVTVLAHEARNYLQTIQANVEMLQLQWREHPESLRDLGCIEGATHSIQKLLEEIRQYAAPILLKREPCSLRSIWQKAWDNIAIMREGREVELRDESGGVDVHCLVDAQRMHQVFRNMLENSLAACGDPALIELKGFHTKLGTRQAIGISFRDNGSGLNDEQRRRAFEAFYTTKSNGTGLGLAIVKRIVEAHGGRIELGPTSTRGAEFIIRLPLS